jgi:hypothetical protein
LAHYTDKNSIFQKAGPQPLPEQLRGDRLRTQFGRALNALGIQWIAAHSPEAKGQIERLFETLQDRLVRKCAWQGSTTSLPQIIFWKCVFFRFGKSVSWWHLAGRAMRTVG